MSFGALSLLLLLLLEEDMLDGARSSMLESGVYGINVVEEVEEVKEDTELFHDPKTTFV